MKTDFLSGGACLELRPAEIVILQRERTNSFAGGGENGVAEGWGDPSECFLSDSSDRIVGRTDKMNGDFRYFRARQQWKVVKIALGDASLLNGYFLFERGGKSHDNLHLDLTFGGQWVY